MKKIILTLLIFCSFIFVACDNDDFNENELIEKKKVIADRIEENKVSEDDIKRVEEKFKKVNSILDCTITIKGKIAYVKIKFDDSTELSNAKLRCNGDLGDDFIGYDIYYEIYNSNFDVKGFWMEDYFIVAWDDVYDYE